MSIDKEQVINHLCRTVSCVYVSIGDYSESSDCFCGKKDMADGFRHKGETLEYVRAAVIEKLKRDGFNVYYESLEEGQA